MTQLTNVQVKERDQHETTLRTQRDKLEESIMVYNAATAEAYNALQIVIDGYNTELENEKGWTEDINSLIQEYIDHRSDVWQDGDKGQAVTAWAATFLEIDLESICIEAPAIISIDEFPNHSEEMGNLAREAID